MAMTVTVGELDGVGWRAAVRIRGEQRRFEARPVAAKESRRAEPIIDVRCATSWLDMAHVALVLGEQRAWLEGFLETRLDAFQPDARAEYSMISEYYAPPQGAIVLARVDGEPAGVAGVHAKSAERGELKRLYVRPHLRGHRLGHRMLETIVEAAKRLGLRSLYLETSPERLPAANQIFKEAGFVETPCELGGFDCLSAFELQLDAVGRLPVA